ncbi:MAG: LptF/LptG family permease, partial [Calditrichota bacterium]
MFIFTLNLLLQQLKRIVGKGIPFPLIVEFFVLNLAWILALAVPMAVLISTVAAFGRLSADGEITALRASGISPWQLIRGPLAASVLVGLGVWWFNNYQLPNMNHRTKMLQIDISRKKPTAIIEPNVYTFAIPNYVLHARDVFPESGGLAGVTIYDEHIPEARATVSAETGLLKFVPAQEKYILTLYSGQIHRPSNREPAGYEVTTFDSALFRIPAPGILMRRGKEGYRGDRELSVKELLTQIRQLNIQTDQSGDYIKKRISSYMVEVHKKFSIPAACLVFILLGAPLGMLTRR